jgi:putative phosphoribosyl transferase
LHRKLISPRIQSLWVNRGVQVPGRVEMSHLPYADRIEAGRRLATELSFHAPDKDAVVLALARGGVPVGVAVADRLHLPLDIIVVRKLGVPWQPEVAFGAITARAQVMDEPMVHHLGIPAEDVREIVAREQAETLRREAVYRDREAAIDICDRTVILIDDGFATGSTMVVAVQHARLLKPARVIVAVPVGSREACERLREVADDVICLASPHLFFSVGEWYREFPQVSDAEVQHLLAEGRQQLRRHLSLAVHA